MLMLNEVEARVVGSLMEKESTTPEYYPLSLNALVNACNQRSSRDPVLELTERDARGALSTLEERGLVRVLADARVPKYEHRMRDPLQLRRDEVAVLCLLLLRGPQTAAELRARAERLYSFDDTEAVLATLERMAARDEPVVRMMARQPGAREARWRQLLDGAAEESGAGAVEGISRPEGGRRGAVQAPAQARPQAEREELLGRIAVLEERLAAVEARVGRLGAAFGVE